MGMIKEFREFISRGNVIDLAVGVIIGAAFGRIISSLVDDIIMPPIGLLLNGVEFKQMRYVLKPATSDASEVSIDYGMFIQLCIEFIIIAWAVFLVVKAINRMKRKQEVAPLEAPPPPRSEVLLEEIRDLLKRNQL
jgi:large conductance mechanosensitive channel